MSALSAALCRRGIILWLAAVLLLASRSTHSAPVYDQDTTQVAEYDGAVAGCYFNFQRYQEGDRIVTSEPCLNCTCHNRMLMCYLKVCPFTKAIGQDCTVEKRPDQCCPVITCLEVPVQLLTSTTSAPADSTAVGFHDNYGCHVDEKFYPDGAMLPVEHHNPCELCYCIRNRTTCVMQECTLQVAGCKPVYQPGVCCPIKYNCEYDEVLSTTVGPTPGLITTTPPPGASSQCYHEDKVYEDGDLIYSDQPCEHCYCFRGEIACAVQNCGTPMQAHGKNCTALPPPEGECCPTTYECEKEQGITLPEEAGEQLPGQVPHELLTTESPMLIDEEDQQVKKHSEEETFPGAENVISHEGEEEENIQGTIEHVTQEHISSTEKFEEQPATSPAEENAVSETETIAIEKETSPPPTEVISEEAITTKVPSDAEATKTEAPTTVQKIEESIATEAPAVELPEASSISEGLGLEEETVTTEHVPEEHVSTEESVVEKEQSIEPAISEETQTESVKPEETTSPHKELPTEVTEAEKTTEKGQVSVTEAPERPEISTEIVEKVTLPVVEVEQPSISTVPESTTEKTKESEDKLETTSSEILATETEAPIKKTITSIPHEESSTEEITTEKEISHLTEIAVTEEVQSTEVSLPTKHPAEKEQKPMVSEGEEEQRPEEPTSEHAVIEKEQATVGAKKEDSGLTESPIIGEEHITTEGQRVEESTPEIPAQSPSSIPIPERSPEQKAEDKNVYHVTEDSHDTTHPEIISPDNLITEHPQEVPTTYIPQEQETTLALSEETSKPSAEETEVAEEGSAKPYPKEVTEINLPSQHKPDIEIQTSTEPSVTTHIPEEKTSEETEKPSVPKELETEIQSTEKTFKEELPTKELGIEESGSFEQVSGEKEIQPKKEQSNEEEIETQPPIITEPEISTSIPVEYEHSMPPEISTSIPAEHEHSVPPNLEDEQTTKGEHITIIPEQSTVPQIGEVETEITLAEKEKSIEEHVTEQPAILPDITEEENETQTEKSISKEVETTVAIKMTEEAEEKPTTQTSVEKEKTEQPEQYSTDKISEEAATIESHGVQQTEAPAIEKKPEAVEGTEGVSTENIELQTEVIRTEKEPSEEEETSEETIRVKPTEVTTETIEQTELPHPIETSEAEKESEEKISVPVSTEEVQTEIPVVEIGSTESPAMEETEKIQTEPSVTEEYIPSQPSIPSDRKEDQESVELKPSEEKQESEEQVTQKPSLEEKKETETYEEPQKTTIPSEEAVTESVLPEEKLTEVTDTTTLVETGEAVTQPAVQEQPEVASEQPENVTTEISEQEEQTQGPITEEQPEIHVRKETEAPISVIHEGTSVTPTSAGEEDVSKSTETASEDSTTLGSIEKSTKHKGEVPVETENIPSTESVLSESETMSSEEIQPEIVPSTESASSVSESISLEEKQPEIISSTESASLESSKSESVSSEESQPETHEQTTQSLITEEESSQKGDEEFTEISTKESAITETPKVPMLTETQPQNPEEKEVISTEPPIHEKQEESSTVAIKEIPEIQITTEIPLEKVPQYSTETSISEETPIEKESTSESASRPSGIPGEGNCLIEGQSYSNNSAVPPANACQTSCRCISSIVQCELVQCPAPPAHLSNCMPVYTSGESCCPMYACDSTPTAELESDSHVIEPHIPEVEEDQKTSLPAEISTEQPAIEVTEAAKEYSTLAGETSMPETHPAEVTIPSVSPSEEELELTTEKQQTTLKSVEPVYEQPTTIAQSIEQQPEEHTISSVPEIAQESASQVSEEEHYTVLPNVPGEITEGKISEKEESVTESAISTQQPQEETVEEQTPVSGEEQQVITSTHISAEDKIHGEEEEITTPTVTEEKKISVPVEVEEISTSTEKEEEITTIGVGKEEEITTTIEEKSSEEESVKEQSTLKSIEEGDKEQSEEEKIPTSEKSIIDEEELSAKPEVSEEQKTVEPTEYESTSIPEIQFTTEHKFESETGYEKEKEHEIATSTESEQATQSEESESQTKLPDIGPSSVETHEPIAPVAESTTLIHDHTMNEEVLLEEHATIKSIEVSTEESKEEIKPEFLTKVPEIEHVTLPIASVETEITTEQELEKSNEETAKPVEEFTTEISHEETLPETTESTGKESMEHAEEHTEPSEKEKESSVTILPEEQPSVTESPISTEQPIRVETSKGEAEHEKPTEPSIVHEPESTQISTEQHPEAEIESHTSELPVEEHTITEEISTTSISTEKEAGEQPVTSIKEIQPSLDEVGTKQPIVPETESETPTVEEEHITIPIEEHTTKSEEHLVEEQTVISEGEATESSISTAEITESVTSQEEQIGTEKTIESAKPETELPSLTEHTIIPEIYKEKEEQKPEVGITKETDKEESVTQKAIKEETATSADLTEKYPAIEEHTEQEVEIKTHAPMELETTIAPKEQKPEEETTSEPERPLSEEATITPSLIPEEHSISAEAEEKEKDTHKPEYQTTESITEEETSKPVTEISDVEKLSAEEESATTESATEKPEESITKVSVEISTTEKFAEVPSETEKPVVPEQETELPEQQQGETTTKSTEDAVTEEKLPEEIIPVEVIPETEEKPSEISTVSDEEAHSTESSLPIETTSIHEEEQPSISKLQPTERPLPSEEETLVTEEMQPSKPEEGEVQPGISEEPQPTTEHALETSVPVKTEEHPEISLEAAVSTEEPITVSGVLTELPEEKTTIGSISSEETETQGPIKPEEGAQPEETPIEHVTKTQPVSTELPIGESTEEISDEEIVHSQEIEEVSHPHFDHFPEATVKPETDYSAEGGLTLGSDEEHLRPVNHTVETERPYHEHRPATTLAPHIPEYSDQSGEDYPHFPPQSGSLNPDEDYDEDEQIYGPGTCRYGGKVYVSAQQIPRDDPCDFCFCFRSDIICLQQSCPPPIPGCHEEPISGFCCPRYECPVSMAMSLNLTTTTTTTTTTLPPHFHAHAYKGAAKRSGCQIRGQAYRVGEVIKSTSGPCLHCTCGGDGNMKCEPRMCSPEPMLRQMIATAAAKRRR